VKINKTPFEVLLREKSVQILLVFNCILLVAGWVMSLVAFFELPRHKDLLFFGIPLLQTALFLIFIGASQGLTRRRGDSKRTRILREAVFLLYIFVQLLLIHIQRSRIFAAHGVSQAFNPFYVLSLLLIMLLLVPYFKLRLKMRD